MTALGNGVVFAFLVPLMDERHLSGAGFFFTFDALMFFAMRAVGGRWSDRYGRWRVLIPGLLALGISLTILTAFPVFPAFVIAALLWGGAISLVIPELNALAVDLVPPERRGAALATYTGSSRRASPSPASPSAGWRTGSRSPSSSPSPPHSSSSPPRSLAPLRKTGMSAEDTEGTESQEGKRIRKIGNGSFSDFLFNSLLFLCALCVLCALCAQSPCRRVRG